MDRGKLSLIVGAGLKSKRRPDPEEDIDSDEMLPIDEEDGDMESEDIEGEEDSPELLAANNLIAAVSAKNPQGIVDAIKAIAGS